jgi:excisionase family DNA binding protein
MIETNNDNANGLKIKMAYSVNELSDSTSFSKAYLRNEIRSGRLKAYKRGRRVLIFHEDFINYKAQYLSPIGAGEKI